MSIQPTLFHLGKKERKSTLWALDPHSKTKHELLVDYLLRYFDTTYPRGGDNLRLTIVDGFAGPGEYDGGEEGSPLRFLRAVQEAEVRLGETSRKGIDLSIRFFFVEEREDRCRHLRNLLAKRREEFGKHHAQCEVLEGRFEDRLDNITTEIKRHNPRRPRALFFLDQYGYAQVHVDKVRAILRLGEHIEVIWTIACGPLLAFERGRRGIPQLGLTAADVELIHAVAAESADPYVKEHVLATMLARNSGARYFSPFMLPPDRNGWMMQVIHLTHNSVARSKMLESGQECMATLAHIGPRGFGVIGHDSTKLTQPEWSQTSFLSEGHTLESRDKLVGSIYNDLRGKSDMIPVGYYIASKANGTSETDGQMLDHLQQTGFRLLTPDGKLRRKGSRPRSTDLIDTTRRPLLY